MNYELRLLEECFGGRWCGVKFGKTSDVRIHRAMRPMRFCEAIAGSRTGPIVLTPQLMNCPGGKRCLGWNTEEETIAQALAEKAGIERAAAFQVLRSTPRLKDGPGEVTVGTCETPDVVLSFSQPVAAMKLLREWQRPHGRPLVVEASGFMSVCGMVAVKAYLTDEICISLGCPDAREYGSIGRDRLVVGLPMQEVRSLSRSLHAAVRKTIPTAPPGSAAKMTVEEGTS